VTNIIDENKFNNINNYNAEIKGEWHNLGSYF
jgi:hypothetical protein